MVVGGLPGDGHGDRHDRHSSARRHRLPPRPGARHGKRRREAEGAGRGGGSGIRWRARWPTRRRLLSPHQGLSRVPAVPGVRAAACLRALYLTTRPDLLQPHRDARAASCPHFAGTSSSGGERPARAEVSSPGAARLSPVPDPRVDTAAGRRHGWQPRRERAGRTATRGARGAARWAGCSGCR
jgi:hypothetical protein